MFEFIHLNKTGSVFHLTSIFAGIVLLWRCFTFSREVWRFDKMFAR